jgi:L,D-peptidoglycan transpeptidase YkuD (ErfK/YbiS/YcfS/YnhG family)
MKQLVLAVIAAVLTVLVAPPASAATNTKIPSAVRFQPSSRTLQALVVTSTSWSSTYATLTTWERSSASSAWRKRASGPARVGYNGMAVNRLQNSGKTPAGKYGLSKVLTPTRLSGVALPQYIYYPGTWWPLDPRDPKSYNTIQRRSQYSPAVVVNYNLPWTDSSGVRHYADVTKGGAIFLHNNGRGATAGCVSIPADRMDNIARWLTPSKYPAIIIGEDDWLKTT